MPGAAAHRRTTRRGGAPRGGPRAGGDAPSVAGRVICAGDVYAASGVDIRDEGDHPVGPCGSRGGSHAAGQDEDEE